MKYKDLFILEEDARIQAIGNAAMKGQVVAFVTDDEPGKCERYVSKLLKAFPQLREKHRFRGPVAGCITVQIMLNEE